MIGPLALLSGQALMRSMLEQRAGDLSLHLMQAFYLGEAGIDRAIHELRGDSGYAGAGYTAPGAGTGGYAMEVTPDGPWRRVIRSTGFYPSDRADAPGHVRKTVEAVVQIAEGSGPGYGVLGVRSVRLEGVHGGRRGDGIVVDSYDSRHGPYDDRRASGRVRVCTNSREDRAVALIGRVAIRGDLLLGPGGDPEAVLWRAPKAQAVVSGSVSVASAEAPLEPVEMPRLPDGGRLSISGRDVVTLPGGLHRFRAIDISGRGSLVFTGPTEVYVEDSVRISGQGRIHTASELPTNLALYVGGAHVSLGGDAALFAKVTAPYATVDISGAGDLYGAVIGREIVIRGDADLHYDEAWGLYDEALNPPRDGDRFRVTIVSWRELAAQR